MAGEPKARRFFGGKSDKNRKEESTDKTTLGNPFVQMVSFVLFIVGVVLLTNVNLGVAPATITVSSIGEPAVVDVKATRDFSFVQTDPEATERKRAEAAAQIPSIYDHDVDLRGLTIDQIRKAFKDVRGPLSRAEAEHRRAQEKVDEPEPEKDDEGAPEDKEVPKEAPKVAPEEPKPLTEEALREFRVRTAEAMRDNFDLALKTVVIPDGHYVVLATHGFAQDSEEALVGLVDTLMQRRVVAGRRLLEVENRGITLRRVRKGTVEQTSKIYDIDESFLSVTDLDRELEILAPGRLRGITDLKLRQTILAMAAELCAPNTLYNHAETTKARDAARTAVQDLVEQESFRKGQIIVRAGDRIEERHFRIVNEMEGDQDARVTNGQVLIGSLVVTLLLLALFYVFSRTNISKFGPAPKDMILMGLLILVHLGLLQGLRVAFDRLGEGWTSATPEMLYYGVPLALGGMIVRLVSNSETAMVFAIVLALFSGLAMDQSLTFGAFVMCSSLIGAHAVGKVCHRMDLLKAGLQVGLVNAAVVLAIFLLHGEITTTSALGAVLAAFAGGLLSGILGNALLPLIEVAFHYTTDIKLLELADLNHPAIKELILKAPGTYHHSVVVGTLAKEACEAINANPLLARVGAYYHDIGKGKNPHYFAENQRDGINPHDKLKPNMSTLIIKAHVKDGLELARQHGLPKEILDFIAMHHGTTLIAYFYHRAKSMEDPDIPEVDEKDFRYPGPRPQTRETAVVMLADGIEAASRAMPDPTPARVKGLVQQKINQLFADGQLDECNLTLKDLNAIAKAFIRVLTSLYYTRPQYPGQEKNPGARAANKRKEHSQTGELSRDKHGDISQTGERKRRGRRKSGEDVTATGEFKRGGKGLAKAGGGDSSGPRKTRRRKKSKSGEDVREARVRPKTLTTGELPPMDIDIGNHNIRLTGPLPPREALMEAIAEAKMQAEGAAQAETTAPAEAEGSEQPVDQQTPEDHAPGTDDQPDAGGDSVDAEDQPAAPDDADPPALRRLGLS